MQYTDALKEIRKFANDPKEPASVTVGNILELRIAVRTLLKTIDARADVQHKRAHSIQQIDTVYPKSDSIRVRIVDFIRENDKEHAGVPMVDIFREFRLSLGDMLRHIKQSYGVVSYTIDSKGFYTFYYWCDTIVQFQDKYDGKLPAGHKVVE